MAEYSYQSKRGKREERNILLVGPAGVGKSTFINALCNYLSYLSLDEAKQSKVKVLIPCNFIVTDKDMKKTQVQFGSDSNEIMTNEGQSSTQNCKDYCFRSENCILRIIDSPGISDAINQSMINVQDVLAFISKHGELHAICIVLKPNQSTLSETFQHFIKELFSQLQNHTSARIVFVFTNSSSSSYGPGATLHPLTTMLYEIKTSPPQLEIPFYENNVFFLDNESFRFLVALGSNIRFDPNYHQTCQISWERSRQECIRLLQYFLLDLYKGHTIYNVPDSISNISKDIPVINLQHKPADANKIFPGRTQKLNEPTQQMRNNPYSSGSFWSASDVRGHDSMSDRGEVYNILLMGPTGVGKSTFINALVNYLSFKSLDEAVMYNVKVLIPTRFDVSDENFQKRTVHFGSSPNENMDTRGRSATQSCKAYLLPWGNFVLRIINTPGIGDTRGIDQDRRNVDEILKFLTDYVELHAICILLMPNDARLTPPFSFCIQQLLSRLHTNSSNNIVFIYTNSRSTLYRPGETATPLMTLLDQIKSTPPYTVIPYGKNNIFCLDNESFRFLVALKNGIRFSHEDHQNFSQSWSKSVVEVQRMIHYIVNGSNGQGLAPHKIQDTLIVSQARDAIMQLARPLSDLAKNIQANIQILSQREKEIRECETDEKKLKSKLYIPALNYELKALRQPRTVCASEKCRKPQNMGNEVKFNYPICHDKCEEVDGAEAREHCQAFDTQTGLCRKCKCHYSKHLRIWYETKSVPSEKADPNVKKRLQTQAEMKEAAQDMVRKLEAQIEKYKAEESTLTKYSAYLAIFLKQNGTIDCSDVFKRYLIELIEDEKSLLKYGARNAEIIEGLERKFENYKREQDVLENALRNPNSQHQQITATDVSKIISKISTMQFSGVVFNRPFINRNDVP